MAGFEHRADPIGRPEITLNQVTRHVQRSTAENPGVYTHTLPYRDGIPDQRQLVLRIESVHRRKRQSSRLAE